MVCGQPALEDQHFDTLLNPTLLIEVLSRSTERYDRGAKAEHYRRLDSLQELLLIVQDKPGFTTHRTVPTPFFIGAHLRMAEISEKLVDREKAAYHATRVSLLLQDSDPAFQLLLESAGRILTRLNSEPRR